jgi:hypothetical protein
VVSGIKKGKPDQAYFIDTEAGKQFAYPRGEVDRELEMVRGSLREGDLEGGDLVDAPMKLVIYGMVEYCEAEAAG